MLTELHFQREIIANSDSDEPLLVYSDWLEDRGDPRGELARVQCELDRGALTSDRSVELRRRRAELQGRLGLKPRHFLFWPLDGRRRCTELAMERIAIGRSPSADIVLQHRAVTRIHCVLLRTAEGCILDDPGSLNGTSVNGARVVAPRLLNDRDAIKIVTIRAMFHQVDPESRHDYALRAAMSAPAPWRVYSEWLKSNGRTVEAAILRSQTDALNIVDGQASVVASCAEGSWT